MSPLGGLGLRGLGDPHVTVALLVRATGLFSHSPRTPAVRRSRCQCVGRQLTFRLRAVPQ